MGYGYPSVNYNIAAACFYKGGDVRAQGWLLIQCHSEYACNL